MNDKYYLPDWVKEQHQPWDASKILDFLWLSDFYSAAMLERLHVINITHVLIASWESKQRFPEDFEYMQLSVADTNSELLITHFDTTYEFIENAKTNGGTILVHCMGGISRSPTIVAAYLMKSMNMSAKEAIAFIQEKRRIARPNQNFQNQLDLYQKLGCQLTKTTQNKEHHKQLQKLIKKLKKPKKEDEKSCTLA